MIRSRPRARKKTKVIPPAGPKAAVNVRLDEILSRVPPMARVSVECPTCHTPNSAIIPFDHTAKDEAFFAAREILVRCGGHVKVAVRGGKVRDRGPCTEIVTWARGGLLRPARRSNLLVQQPAVSPPAPVEVVTGLDDK